MATEVLSREDSFVLKRKLQELGKYKGSGTELISVYVAAGYPLSEMTNKLRGEASQATNIKSKSTRNNVCDALEKIISYFKTFKSTPKKGIAVFCGNISTNPSKTVIELFSMVPPMELNITAYRCDSTFFLDPLERLTNVEGSYGIVVMDGKDATIAILKGTNFKVLKKVHSTAHSKIHVGGQCLAPDTFVHKSDGVVTEIKNIVANDYLKVSDLGAHQTIDSICPIIYKNMARPMFSIRTKHPSMQIKASAGHRFFVLTEFGIEERLVRDLKKGDVILSVSKINHVGVDIPLDIKLINYNNCSKMPIVPKYFNESIAQLLGYVLGDGHFDGDKVVLYESKKELVDFYYKLIADNFGITPVIRVVDKTKQKGCFAKNTYYELRVYGRNFGRMIKQTDQNIYAKSNKKDIANIVMKSKNKTCAAFIRGLFDAEGYIAGRKIEIAMTAPLIIKKLQMLLLRFGIISSVYEKSTGSKQVKPQWGLIISDLESIKIFSKEIGFSLSSKKTKCKKICELPITTQYVRQVPVNGKYISKIAHKLGMTNRSFDGLGTFFANTRRMGQKRFDNKVIPVFNQLNNSVNGKCNSIVNEMEMLSNSDLIPTVITNIDPLGVYPVVYDLTIPNHANFIANNLVVHNSAARFQRLIEESIQKYYKRVGEYMDLYFVNSDLKGVIVGGPGPAKEDFMKMKPFNYQIEVMGVVNTGYIDEYGLREVMMQSGDIISQQEMVVEKRVVEDFIKKVVKGGLATYGLTEVENVIANFKAGSILLSVGLKYRIIKYKSSYVKGEVAEVILKTEHEEPPVKTDSQGNVMEIIEDQLLLDDLMERAREKNIGVHIISVDTSEGAQFFNTFYGIGALLRYK